MGKTDQFFYIMYRFTHNPNLQNRKRFRRPCILNDGEDSGNVYLHRPNHGGFLPITAHASFLLKLRMGGYYCD